MPRLTVFAATAMTLFLGSAASSQSGPPTRLNEGKNWVPKLPGGRVSPNTVKLEIAAKNALIGKGWGTSSSSVYGQADAQAQSIRLRYYVGTATVPSLAPVTIEASADQGFKDIYKSKSFTPYRGVMEVSKGLALVPLPGPGSFVNGVTKWYLRAKTGNGHTSNAVVVNLPAHGGH